MVAFSLSLTVSSSCHYKLDLIFLVKVEYGYASLESRARFCLWRATYQMQSDSSHRVLPWDIGFHKVRKIFSIHSPKHQQCTRSQSLNPNYRHCNETPAESVSSREARAKPTQFSHLRWARMGSLGHQIICPTDSSFRYCTDSSFRTSYNSLYHLHAWPYQLEDQPCKPGVETRICTQSRKGFTLLFLSPWLVSRQYLQKHILLAQTKRCLWLKTKINLQVYVPAPLPLGSSGNSVG